MYFAQYILHLHYAIFFSLQLHLQDWIRGNVSKCERSLFIFDEIDKMPLGMTNSIKPFIDYHESIDGIDFRYGYTTFSLKILWLLYFLKVVCKFSKFFPRGIR